jgi:hypothetical protein
MRIAYHNPWTDSSENQAFMSMAEAGRRIGVQLVACANAQDIDACRPDFVLSVASSVPKVSDHPTYLNVHEPKSYLFDQPQRLRNILSYDGYLTISDRLERFIRDFCYGTGRHEEPGFFFLTPQVSALRCEWERPDRAETLRVAYFGTNWNRRMPLLFRALDPMGIAHIHGPEASWKGESLASYKGPVAFDGVGPQRIYAECGMGLALMDERWQQEDIISNRIFEISSVGAVSVCPDMPWTRKWFGDSVLYIDQAQPMRDMAEQIRTHHAFCRANPDRARQMGEEARRIFEAHFSAERLLHNACDYHRRKTALRDGDNAALGAPPAVSVVIRCGGRPTETLRRAVDSIRRQSFGHFTVILAKYHDADLSTLPGDVGGAITGFDEFLIEGGGRAEMLYAALRRVVTPYFAVLDDDDFWLSDHMETLFRAGRRERADFDVAFSGVVDFDQPVRFSDTLFFDRNIGRFGFDKPLANAHDIQDAIHLGCFVARSDLLTPELLATPAMHTAEDSLLICLLARRSKPIFSWKPTAFYRRDPADGSHWRTDPQRTEDMVSLALRGGFAFAPAWLPGPGFALADHVWPEARKTIGATLMGEHLHRLVVGKAGWRVPSGITCSGEVEGFLTHGPYVHLAAGRYTATFLAVPDAAAAVEVVGEVSVAAMPPGITLSRAPIRRDSSEIVLRFEVEAGMEDWRFEFPISSRGVGSFTIASVCVYHDREDAPAIKAGPGPAVVRKVDHTAAALRAEIDALRNSTSWRVTAPLRAASRLLRRERR